MRYSGDFISARLSAAEIAARAQERDGVGDPAANASAEADEVASETNELAPPYASPPERRAYLGPEWPLPADVIARGATEHV